jgi:hypothetical protein
VKKNADRRDRARGGGGSAGVVCHAGGGRAAAAGAQAKCSWRSASSGWNARGCVGAVAEWAPRWRFSRLRGAEAQRPQQGADAGILLSGVSPRNYARVLPEMAEAESVGISRSAASREFIAASEDEFKALCERGLDGLENLTSDH